MNFKYYLIISEDKISFNVDDGYAEIKETDIEISQEQYKEFFDLQSQGKHFKPKSIITGTGLFDYIEEYTPEPIKVPKSEVEILKDQVVELQSLIVELTYNNLTGGI